MSSFRTPSAISSSAALRDLGSKHVQSREQQKQAARHPESVDVDAKNLEQRAAKESEEEQQQTTRHRRPERDSPQLLTGAVDGHGRKDGSDRYGIDNHENGGEHDEEVRSESVHGPGVLDPGTHGASIHYCSPDPDSGGAVRGRRGGREARTPRTEAAAARSDKGDSASGVFVSPRCTAPV